MAIKVINGVEREDLMVQLYGEACSLKQAGKILGAGICAIKTMCGDGRLEYACAGRKVDVRSIARYIEAPAVYDEEARKTRAMLRRGSSYAV